MVAVLYLRKFCQVALQPVRQIWLGMHFIYGCVEGTFLALVLIVQIRWKMRASANSANPNTKECH